MVRLAGSSTLAAHRSGAPFAMARPALAGAPIDAGVFRSPRVAVRAMRREGAPGVGIFPITNPPTPAYALFARTGTIPVAVRVLFVIGVPGRAMSCGGMHGDQRRGRSQVVLSVRDGFQVLWPNAEFHAAEVVNRKAVRDGADEQFVGCPVGKDIPGPRATASKDAVAASERRASPKPACLGELNLGVEPLEQGKLASHLGLILHGVARPGVLAPRPLSIVPDRGVAKWSEG